MFLHVLTSHRKKFVIRVRAEADQFLLSCHTIETFVLWLQSLFTAIDLALPLDDREIPRDLSVPRRTRRRVLRQDISAVPINTALVREQEEIISTQFPRLAERRTNEIVSAEATYTSDQEDAIEEMESASSSPRISRHVSLRSSTSSPALRNTDPRPSPTSRSSSDPTPLMSSRSALLSRARTGVQSSSFLPAASSSVRTRNPNITSDGKWRPRHQWTHVYDMMYAKRCMAILTHRSPRKSNLVIMKGKQWIVDWATGRLERCEPPDYREVFTASGKMVEGTIVVERELRVGQ